MIDAATVREQFQRFSRQWDDNSLLTDYADLLRRYLSQPLSDSETAWAYRTLANVLACSEHAAEAVDVLKPSRAGFLASLHGCRRRSPGIRRTTHPMRRWDRTNCAWTFSASPFNSPPRMPRSAATMISWRKLMPHSQD